MRRTTTSCTCSGTRIPVSDSSSLEGVCRQAEETACIVFHTKHHQKRSARSFECDRVTGAERTMSTPTEHPNPHAGRGGRTHLAAPQQRIGDVTSSHLSIIQVRPTKQQGEYTFMDYRRDTTMTNHESADKSEFSAALPSRTADVHSASTPQGTPTLLKD